MARKRRYAMMQLEWRCPHCGFAHTPADLMRLDNDTLQCKGCVKPFPSGPGEERKPG